MYDVVVTGADGFISKNLEQGLKKNKINYFLIKKNLAIYQLKKIGKKFPNQNV